LHIYCINRCSFNIQIATQLMYKLPHIYYLLYKSRLIYCIHFCSFIVHWIGSESELCNDYGACRCKSGVMGDKCDQCQPNHHSLTVDGCRLFTSNLFLIYQGKTKNEYCFKIILFSIQNCEYSWCIPVITYMQANCHY